MDDLWARLHWPVKFIIVLMCCALFAGVGYASALLVAGGFR